jgi:hypothetical protein
MARFMCLLYVNDGAFDGFSPEDSLKFDAVNRAFDDGLRQSGHYVYTSAMVLPRDSVTIRKRSDKVSATDGPFAETKEHLGGFLILEAKDRDEVVAIMSKDPMADYASLEIREIKDIADPDWREWSAWAYGPR